MSDKIPYPVISENGRPTHVVMPLDEFLTVFGRPDVPPKDYVFVPNDVGAAVADGVSPLRAWREHLRLTQEDVARRMGVKRPAYTQMEQSAKPHRTTLEKAAAAFGIEFAQLVELYDDEPVTTPDEMRQ